MYMCYTLKYVHLAELRLHISASNCGFKEASYLTVIACYIFLVIKKFGCNRSSISIRNLRSRLIFEICRYMFSNLVMIQNISNIQSIYVFVSKL